MHPAVILGIVADDLTGANDTLVQFAEAGFLARLSLGDPENQDALGADPVALARVTDARPLDAARARSRTGDAVDHLSRTGINQLYVKIDSTMRGSVSGQIAGALDAWGKTHPDPFAVVCPAYPVMGRVVDEGHLFVHGNPVELSPAGTDPVTPVHTSRMIDLLPDAVLVPNLPSIPAGERAQVLLSAATHSQVLIVDAVVQSDLDVLASVLREIGPRAVPVGSAGLGAALAAQLSAPATNVPAVPEGGGRTLVVVTSLHDVSREQAKTLLETAPREELLALQPSMDDLRTPEAIEEWLELALPPYDPPSTIMVVSPQRNSSSDRNEDGASNGALVANALATLTRALMNRHQFSNLVLMGGDGARAVLSECGAGSVTVLGAVEEGTPFGIINGGRAHGVRIITKAGGFGTPKTLVDILSTITQHTPSSTEASS